MDGPAYQVHPNAGPDGGDVIGAQQLHHRLQAISVNSLEARVPFGDLDFVEYVMSIDPEKKLNKYGMGKYLLRKGWPGWW